jgi:hypothetical protein
MEGQLFDHFFPQSVAGSAADGGAPLEPLMDPLCTLLYDTLRPAYIQLQGLDELCELVDILKHEVRACLYVCLSVCLPACELVDILRHEVRACLYFCLSVRLSACLTAHTSTPSSTRRAAQSCGRGGQVDDASPRGGGGRGGLCGRDGRRLSARSALPASVCVSVCLPAERTERTCTAHFRCWRSSWGGEGML